MKKQFLACTLGMMLCLPPVATFAQGSIIFSNYGQTTYAPVSYGQTTSGSVSYVGSEFTAYLYYAPGTVTDPDQLALLGNHVTFSDTMKGFFNGGTVPIPGYLSGPITFEVVACPTDTSTLGPVSPFDVSGAGHSPLFTLPSLPIGEASEFGPGLQPFSILVPEPSTGAILSLASGLLFWWQVRCRRSA